MQVLASVPPWLAALDLRKQASGTPTETLLARLFAATERHALMHPTETQHLWQTVCAQPSNVAPVLDLSLIHISEPTRPY